MWRYLNRQKRDRQQVLTYPDKNSSQPQGYGNRSVRSSILSGDHPLPIQADSRASQFRQQKWTSATPFEPGFSFSKVKVSLISKSARHSKGGRSRIRRDVISVSNLHEIIANLRPLNKPAKQKLSGLQSDLFSSSHLPGEFVL